MGKRGNRVFGANRDKCRVTFSTRARQLTSQAFEEGRYGKPWRNLS